MKLGLFLSCEEYPPDDLLAQARLATEAGMHGLWISDHFHPWIDAQGQSPFVWSMIGALTQVSDLPITTAVTCPTVRVHPAIIAQAAATSAVLANGRFTLGLGTGEALNESITGRPWPNAESRLAMLAEAIDVIRELWGGASVNHHGRYYTVENARIYTRPERPPQIYISGFGPRSTAFAAAAGDGYITTSPDPKLLALFREQSGGKPALAGSKGCYAGSADEAAKIAHHTWPTVGLPGEINQVLPTPAHFDQVSSLVTEEQVRDTIPCGPDPAVHLDAVRAYAEAGFDEVYVTPIGPHYRELIDLYTREIMPAVA